MSAQLSNASIDNDTASWVSGLGATMHDKLAAVGLLPKRDAKESAKLATFIDGYIKSRSDVKGDTAVVVIV